MGLFSRKIPELSDEELMEKLIKRDKDAFEELYWRYSKRMVNYFHKMLDYDLEKARDFTHDLFIKLIEKPGLFRAGNSFKTWIYSIAYNMCKNEYKRNSRLKDLQDNLIDEQYESSFDDFEKDDFKNSLEKAISKLDINHRNTFVLRFRDGLSISEIAEICRCPEGTVKSRLFFSLKKLAKLLNEYDPNYRLKL